MSSPVVEKTFIWKFIDQITEGVKQARQTMQEAVSAAKDAGIDVKDTGNNWKQMGTDAEEAAHKASQAMNKAKENIESLKNSSRQSFQAIKDQAKKLNDAVNRIPTSKTFNLKAKFDDQQLRSFSRKVHDVPDQKSIWLRIKDGFTAPLRNAQREIDNTKHSFSILKSVMAGTFLGGAILNGVYAIGNGLKEAAGAGMQFDTEQQKMLATWHTLTNSTSQAKGMVNTINDLSIKTGQATDTINELEQGFYHLHSRKSEADDMTKAMLNMGDAVGLSGQQLTQVEQDMVHGLATGKVTQGELNQIGMYFPMIDEQMAKHFHTTVAGMRKMASAGKITGKDLEEVFEQMGNSGKYKHAVDNMMQTTWGSMRTIRSMVPRLAGALEQGLFQARNPLVGAIAKWTTDPATKRGFQNFGRGISDAFNGLFTVVSELIRPFNGLNKIIGDIIKQFASGVWLGMITSFKVMSEAIKLVSDALSAVFGWLGKMLSAAGRISGLSQVFRGTGAAVKGVGIAVGAILGPMIALRGASMAVLGVMKSFETVEAIIKGVGGAIKMVTMTTKVWTAVTKAQAAGQSVLDAALDANPIGIAVVAITALVAGLVLAYKYIKPFREGVDRLGASLKRAFTGKAQWEKDLGRQFKNLNKAFDNDAKAFQKKLRKWNTDLWNGMTGNAKWEKDLHKQFDNAKKEYDRYSKQQLKSEQIMQKERQKNWDNFWNGLSKKSRSAWNDMSKHASNGMQELRSAISKHSKNVSKAWDNTWSIMQRITVNAWKTIRQHSSNGMETVRGAISSGMSRVSSIWNSGWNSMASFFKGIWSGIKQAAADGMNGVINVINAAIGGINKVWSFFTGHGTGLSSIGHVHFAQGGVVRRHLSVINDGDGPDWKELVQTPDGGLYMSQERNWTGFLPEGTRVYSGSETRQIMNAVGVSHYASGGIVGDIGEGIDWAKGSLENLGSWLGDKFSALEDFLADPLKATKGLLEKATNGLYNGLGHYADLAHGAMDKLTQPIADWFKKGLEKLEAQFESGGASPDLIRAAAAKMHVAISGGDISHIMNVIQHESGGRANAVNNWDSNARAGHPSKGILQFVQSTFNNYAMPGHTNILSPFDQLLAMFNDTSWRSDLTLGGWSPHGARRYANGGEVFGLTNAIIGDNPQHHEIILNPYATSAEPLLDRAFETTAAAQPASQANSGGSKLDRMISLLEQLVDLLGNSSDPQVVLDVDGLRKVLGRKDSGEFSMKKG